MVSYSSIFPISSGGGSIAGFEWSEKTADFTAEANKAYYCDTALGDILLTLPSSPSPGDEVGFLLIGANKVNVTSVDKIKGSLLATDFVKQTGQQYLMFVLFYVDSTTGWNWDSRYDSYIANVYIGAGDPLSTNVILFLQGNGANNSTTISDSSFSPKSIIRYGDTKLSTAQSKYGGSSIYFDGTGDYIDVADSTSFAFGTGGFTLELWYYTATARDVLFFDFRPAVNGTYPALVVSAGSLIYYVNATALITAPFNLSSQWCHIALSRASGVSRLFVNGVKVGEAADSRSYLCGANRPRIGATSEIGGANATFFALGYYDSIRITNIGRYTANFNPETDTYLNL